MLLSNNRWLLIVSKDEATLQFYDAQLGTHQLDMQVSKEKAKMLSKTTFRAVSSNDNIIVLGNKGTFRTDILASKDLSTIKELEMEADVIQHYIIPFPDSSWIILHVELMKDQKHRCTKMDLRDQQQFSFFLSDDVPIYPFISYKINWILAETGNEHLFAVWHLRMDDPDAGQQVMEIWNADKGTRVCKIANTDLAPGCVAQKDRGTSVDIDIKEVKIGQRESPVFPLYLMMTTVVSNKGEWPSQIVRYE